MEIKNGSRVICVLGMLLVVLAVVALSANARDTKFMGYVYEDIDKINPVDDGTWIQFYINDNYHPEYNTTTTTDDLGNHGYYEVTISSSILSCRYIISFRAQDKNGGSGSVNWTWSCSNTLVPLDDIICLGDTSDNGQNDAPICSLTVIPSSGHAPLPVTFYMSVSNFDGSISSWELDTDDDGAIDFSGLGNSPTTVHHTYQDIGSYKARLTIIDDDGATDSAIVNLRITPLANHAPTADFTFSPIEPTDRDIIIFIDSSIDADGGIVSYEWDFGDGSTSTEQSPTHQYMDNGTYTVSLKIRDNDGATDTKTSHILVKNIMPATNFVYTPKSPVKISTVLNFNDSSTDSDGSIVNWTWDFGDGIITYGNQTGHIYTNAGIYVVTLTVEDDDGELSNYTLSLTVDDNKRNTPGFVIAVIIGAMIATFVLKRE